MKSFRLQFACSIAILVLSLLSSVSFGQESKVSKSEWKRGYQGFKLLCQTQNLEVVAPNEAGEQLDRVIIVCLGNQTPRDTGVIYRSFRDQRANLLIATDRPLNQSSSFRDLGVLFSSNSGLETASSADAYKSNRKCAIVSDFSKLHPITEDLNEIVTNKPGYLFLDRANNRFSCDVIGELPRMLHPRFETKKRGFLATAENKGQRKALFIADHSIFSNQMIILGDNAKFCLRALDWLSEGGKRDKILIIENGVALNPKHPDDIDINIPPPTPNQLWDALKNLPPEKLREVMNSVAAEAEDRDHINQIVPVVIGLPESQQRSQAILLILATIFLVGLGLFYFMGRTSPPIPFRKKLVAGRAETSTTNRKATREKLANDRRIAAQEIVNQFFQEFAGLSTSQIADSIDKVEVYDPNDPSGGRDASKRLRTGMRSILRQLRTTKPSKWKKKHLDSVAQNVGYWYQLLSQGQLRFVG